MGRTVLPFSQVVLQEEEQLQKFRRALRRADQQVFDALFEYARLHVQAGAYASMPEPFRSVLLSMLIEIHKTTESHTNRIEKLERRIQELENKSVSQNVDGDK